MCVDVLLRSEISFSNIMGLLFCSWEICRRFLALLIEDGISGTIEVFWGVLFVKQCQEHKNLGSVESKEIKSIWAEKSVYKQA